MRPPVMLRWAAVALALAAVALLAAEPAAAFYLPGVAPNDFQKVPLPSPPPSLITPFLPRRISTARVPRLLAARYYQVGGSGVPDLGILLAVLLMCEVV
ncbi:hypothetical protein C2845_PM18G08660 [Panicum miliaceum]|uniref:Uncharacterized protein n=1 Tax=Panicum miliaceum TaxID=4540 RepID=A0A3L6PKG7_PANMI|nr:hypothetical protein C2845_PM18G08660 [Panicum miliaceum]